MKAIRIYLLLLLLCVACGCGDQEPVEPRPVQETELATFDVLDQVSDSSNRQFNYIYQVQVTGSNRGKNYIKLHNLLNTRQTVEAVITPDGFATQAFDAGQFGQVTVNGTLKEGLLTYTWQGSHKHKGTAKGTRQH